MQQMRLMQTCQALHSQSAAAGQCEKANQLLIPSLSIKARKQSHEEEGEGGRDLARLEYQCFPPQLTE